MTIKDLSHRMYVLGGIILFSGLFLAACTSGPSSEERLKGRVLEYWKYRAEKKLMKSYDMEYPLFRKAVPIEKYIRLYSPEARTGKPKIQEVKIDEEGTAMVKLKIPVALRPPFIKRPFEVNVTTTDKWIYTDQDWYHVPTPKRDIAAKERG